MHFVRKSNRKIGSLYGFTGTESSVVSWIDPSYRLYRAVTTFSILGGPGLETPRYSDYGGATMVGADGPRKFLNMSHSRLAKTVFPEPVIKERRN